MAFLEVEYVSKYFSETNGQELCVFKDVRLHIQKSDFVTMVGHSGCGKSTLLNIIAGLETASKGAIILDGKETDTPGLDRMVVFQNFSLLPWMSVCWLILRRPTGETRRAWLGLCRGAAAVGHSVNAPELPGERPKPRSRRRSQAPVPVTGHSNQR